MLKGIGGQQLQDHHGRTDFDHLGGRSEGGAEESQADELLPMIASDLNQPAVDKGTGRALAVAEEPLSDLGPVQGLQGETLAIVVGDGMRLLIRGLLLVQQDHGVEGQSGGEERAEGGLSEHGLFLWDRCLVNGSALVGLVSLVLKLLVLGLESHGLTDQAGLGAASGQLFGSDGGGTRTQIGHRFEHCRAPWVGIYRENNS